MGTSFVHIGDKGFWMRDGVLELWLRLLALHVPDPAEPGTVASAIRDQWLLASRGFFTGCVPHGLDEAVSTPEGEAVVRSAIGSLLAALDETPSPLDKNVLNLLGFEARWERDFDSSRLVEVGRAFMDLLDGKITSDARSTAFMPGSR